MFIRRYIYIYIYIYRGVKPLYIYIYISSVSVIILAQVWKKGSFAICYCTALLPLNALSRDGKLSKNWKPSKDPEGSKPCVCNLISGSRHLVWYPDGGAGATCEKGCQPAKVPCGGTFECEKGSQPKTKKMYIYMHQYIYIYQFIFLFIHIYVYIYKSRSLYIYMYINMFIYKFHIYI